MVLKEKKGEYFLLLIRFFVCLFFLTIKLSLTENSIQIQSAVNLKQAYIFCCGNDLRHYTRRLCDVLCFIILETDNLLCVSAWVVLCINRWERLIQVFAYACVGYFLHTQVIHVSMYYWKSDKSLCAGCSSVVVFCCCCFLCVQYHVDVKRHKTLIN